MDVASTLDFVTAQGRRLEYRLLPGSSDLAPLVFLHEGLGSISLWRDFPEKVAAATGRRALVYSRYGFGGSEVLAEPRPIHYLHDEAQKALPELLDQLGLDRPILVGHSDGASIALIHAGWGGRPVAGIAIMAPHVFVEDVTIAGIVEAVVAFEAGGLARSLGRHHADVERTFRGWSDTWQRPEFRTWNIEDYLPRITCPVLVIQGEGDQYGTMAQLDAIERQVSGPVTRLELAECGHSPHRDQEQAVTQAIVAFAAGLGV